MADSSEGVKKERIGIGLKIILALLVLVLIIFLIFSLDIVFGNAKFTGNVVAGLSDATEKLACKQQAYNDVEYYQEQVPYDSSESYTETTAGSNCDNVYGCSCLHHSWLGLGPCDSCSCTKQRTVTKYRTEQKSRTVTKYKNVCLKVKMWQTPNYNENWLDYPEIYDSDGNRIN